MRVTSLTGARGQRVEVGVGAATKILIFGMVRMSQREHEYEHLPLAHF
jgi:hypothetical protein